MRETVRSLQGEKDRDRAAWGFVRMVDGWGLCKGKRKSEMAL